MCIKNIDLLVEKYLENIIYKDKFIYKNIYKNVLENWNMVKSMSLMKVGKITNTTNVNKFQKTIKFRLIRFVVFFMLFTGCPVTITGISIRPTRPRTDWIKGE